MFHRISQRYAYLLYWIEIYLQFVAWNFQVILIRPLQWGIGKIIKQSFPLFRETLLIDWPNDPPLLYMDKKIYFITVVNIFY